MHAIQGMRASEYLSQLRMRFMSGHIGQVVADALQATDVQRSARSKRVSVNVDLSICERRGSGQEALLVTASGVFKRLGALRAI